ncbi:hypothetical protein [Polyangium sp. 15x6]|uniref:hypothetical protein n=1 Tax=Polyangium sp. 15x6 TaxID=3042687 RepID=UPI00249BD8D0|nr:hypothetical protein [Polyangium sp. 15x6]MDI3285866.1 hypothetical protein [Polyangium sp. 15x6]
MSDKVKSANENVSTEDAVKLEITELDDLDLAAVTGGSEDGENVGEAELPATSNRGCGANRRSCTIVVRRR